MHVDKGSWTLDSSNEGVLITTPEAQKQTFSWDSIRALHQPAGILHHLPLGTLISRTDEYGKAAGEVWVRSSSVGWSEAGSLSPLSKSSSELMGYGNWVIIHAPWGTDPVYPKEPPYIITKADVVSQSPLARAQTKLEEQ